MKDQLLILFIALAKSGKKSPNPFDTKIIAPWEPYVLPVYLLAGLKSTDSWDVNAWELAEMLTTNDDEEEVSKELYRLAEHVDKENRDPFLSMLTTGLHENIETQGLGEFDSEYGKIMQDFNYYEMTKALWLGRAVTGPYKKLHEYFAAIFGENKLQNEQKVLKKCIATLAKLTEYDSEKIAAMLVAGGYCLKK